MNPVGTTAAPSTSSLAWMPPAVLTALAGSFLSNLTGQFVGTNLADIQGGIGASADEASWITTVFQVASAAGIVVSPPLIRALGLRRYLTWATMIFAACAWVCAIAGALPTILFARALQGFAGGGFGPIAFTAIFMLCKGPRLPFGLSLLAFVLIASVNAGPVLSAPIEAAFGWRGLFVAQFVASMLLLMAALRWMPPAAPIDRAPLRTDWIQFALLAIASGSVFLALGQGTRRFWLDSSVVAWAFSIAIGASVGFAFAWWHTKAPILNIRTLMSRRFGIPIALNLVFRATFATFVYLVPLLLAMNLGYRPLEIAQALWWLVVPQVIGFPLAWRAMQAFDSRVPAIVGLLLVALGTSIAAYSTSLVGVEQLRLSLALIGIGQVFFLVPVLLIGAGSLTAEEGPTASIAFNLTTIGGTVVGTGLVSHFVTEREKFHSSVLVEHITAGAAQQGDRLASLVNAWSMRVGDDALATARAVAQIGATVRREAWLLAINEGFAVIALVLIVAAAGVAMIGRSPPLPRASERTPS